MKWKTGPYFSSYSCHCQTQFRYAFGLISLPKGILIFLFTEILLQFVVSVEYLGLRWGFTLLCNSKKTYKNSSTSLCRWRNGEISTEEIMLLHVPDWSCQLRLRYRLLGAASIATVVNSDLAGSEDCLRWRYRSIGQPKRCLRKLKLWLVPASLEHREVKVRFLMLPLRKVKRHKIYWNLSNWW